MAYNKSVSLEKKILAGLGEFSEVLKSGKPIAGQLTSRKVELNLVPQAYGPELVRDTRQMLNVSQSIFAKFLGVSTSCVQKWERGEDDPQPIACRFMDEIRRNPDYWKQRLLDCVVPKATT